jgi:hypothetical protein
MPCGLTGRHQRSGWTHCLPEDEGNMLLRNACMYLQVHTMLQSRKPPLTCLCMYVCVCVCVCMYVCTYVCTHACMYMRMYASMYVCMQGRVMSQAVSRRHLAAEARVIYVKFVVNKVALGQGSLLVLRFPPVNIIPPWFSLLISHLGDEQQPHWWPQFRDTVSLHRHEQHECVCYVCVRARVYIVAAKCFRACIS